MPVTNTQQANIRLNKEQVEGLKNIVEKDTAARNWVEFEETNLPGVIAIKTSRSWYLMAENGEVSELSNSKTTRGRAA
jgi:hypothetical protein